jgi:hypothetical protein
MIHVVDFEKPPFRPLLPPSGPQISAESGRATHSLAPGKPGWPPTSTWPLFSRPTPHAPPQTSGVRSCAEPPPLATACHRPPICQRANGARSRRAAPLFQYVTKPGDCCKEIDPFLPHSLPPNR